MWKRRERNITQETLLYQAHIDTIQHHLNTGILGEGNQAIEEFEHLQAHPYFQGMFTIPPNFPTNSNQALVGGRRRKKTRKKRGGAPYFNRQGYLVKYEKHELFDDEGNSLKKQQYKISIDGTEKWMTWDQYEKELSRINKINLELQECSQQQMMNTISEEDDISPQCIMIYPVTGRSIVRFKGGGTRKTLPKLRKVSYKNKKHHYKLKDPQKKRILAINEGVRYEMKYKNKTQKQAATAKKGRFNILRIYRRNNNIKDCNKITSDMRYMDKKYKLGKTKNICGQKGGSGDEREEKTQLPSLQQAADMLRNEAGVHRQGPSAYWNRLVIRAAQDGDPRFVHLLNDLIIAESQKTQDDENMNGGKRKKRTRKKKKRKTKKQFLYNPNNPKKSFDVYIDKNPEDTIPIKYSTIEDVKHTILKLEKLKSNIL